MITDRIQAYLESIQGEGIPEGVLNRIIEQITVSVNRNMGRGEEAGPRPALRASMLGKCGRAGWYTRIGEDREPMAGRTRLVFMFGDFIEAQVIALSILSGLDITSTQGEVSHVLDGHRITGHTDMVVRLADDRGFEWNIPVEIKSMSSLGYDRAIAAQGPTDDFGYASQLQFYIKAMSAPWGVFVCVNKENGNMEEFKVMPDKEFHKKAMRYIKAAMSSSKPDRFYSTELEVKSIQGKANADKMLESNPTWKMGERKGSWYPMTTGRQILPVQCGYCSFHNSCYEDRLVMETDSGRPVWLVKPEGEEVAPA